MAAVVRRDHAGHRTVGDRLFLPGRRREEILAKLPTDIDLSAAAFPHLSMRRRESALAFPARIYRQFHGDSLLNSNVPSDKGQALWDALLNAGVGAGLQPLGMDALC